MRILLSILFLCFFLFANGQKVYKFNWKKEAIIVGGSGLMVGASYYIDSKREPLTIPPFGASPRFINRLDRTALDNYSKKAKDGSDVLFYGLTLAPLSMLAAHKLEGNKLDYTMMYAQVIALNGSLTFLVKSAANKKRPYYYNSEVPSEIRENIEARKSFFSGHASHTAALSFFTAQVFSDLYPDSVWKPVVWTGAIVLPATTAYLRVKAGRHFPTDVMVGYGVGAGVGLLIPFLHRKEIFEENSVKIAPGSNGVMLLWAF